MKNFLFLCYLLWMLSGFSQIQIHESNSKTKNVSQSIKNFILINQKHDTIQSFLFQAYQKNSKSAKPLYELYLERGEKDHDSYVKFISHYYLSDIALTNGEYPTAIHQAKLAQEISHKNEKLFYLRPNILNLLGVIYYKIRKYDTSLTYFLKAYNINKINNPDELQLGLLININIIRTRTHRYQEAIASSQEIIRLLQKKKYKNPSNYWDNYTSSMLTIGVCHYHLKDYDLAIAKYRIGQNLTRKHNLKRKEMVFDMTLGETFIATQAYDQAFYHLNKAHIYFKSLTTDFDPELHTSFSHLAMLFYKKGEYQKSLDYLSESFKVINASQKEAQVEKIHKMYDLAYKAAKKIDNKELIIKYSEAYRKVIDSFHWDDIQTKDRLYDQDINELEEKNQNLSSQNLQYISIAIIFILITIGLTMYHFKKQKKNKNLFEELQQKQVEAKPNHLSKKKEFVTYEKANSLLKKLKKLEKTNFFLAQDCSLYTTAKRIGTNTTYLSKIINEYTNKSFNEYINVLRIRYFIKQFENDKKFRSYTIKAIASELGYKSVNTFISAFKKQTGINHSYYIKQSLKKEIQEA